MSRENLLYSEIESLSNNSGGSREVADYENDFDDHLSELVTSLRNTLDALRGQGTLFLKEQKNLTGNRPMDFNSYGKVPKLRKDATAIVLEKMVPLIIQSKGFKNATDVVKFFNTFENGSIVQTFAHILLYTPMLNPDDSKKKEIEKKREVLRVIEQKSKIEITERPIPVVQTGTEPKDSRNENVLSLPAPDKPGIDITGRFEFINNAEKKGEVLGMVLCINQAGNWLEGVLSVVFDGPQHADNNIPKRYFRFYALVKDWNNRINLIYTNGNADFFSKGVALKISSKDQIDVWYKTKDNKDALTEFWRASSSPVLMERHFKTLNNALVKQSQWFPLLTEQANNILSYLKSFTGYIPIHDYSERGDTGAITAQKNENRKSNIEKLLVARSKGDVKAGTQIYLSFSQFILENFHRSDYLLASFYCRYYLEQKVLTTADQWRLSYLYAIMRYLHIDRYNRSTVTNFLSGDKEATFEEKHEYVIEAKLFGLGGFYGIGGGGYYRGDFTITCKQWEKIGVKGPAVLRISLWEIGVGIGGGVTLGKSFKAVATTDYLWKPDDFIGSYTIKKVEAGVSGYDLAGIGGLLGIMDIDSKQLGRGLTFKVYDLDANILGVEMEPNNEFESKRKPKSKVGFEASESLGAGSIWKGGKLPVASDVLKLANEATNFGKEYAGTEKNHFKHDSAILTVGAANALRKMCANEMALLVNKGTVVEIIGHTDRSGSDTYNDKLSLNRAKNVEQKIRDICGASLAAQLKSKGMGKKLADGKGPKKNPIDRKVEVKINGFIVLSLI